MATSDWKSQNLLYEIGPGKNNQKACDLLQAIAAFTMHPSQATLGEASHRIPSESLPPSLEAGLGTRRAAVRHI